MKIRNRIIPIFSIIFLSTYIVQAQARDQIRIVGSSTVYPFSTSVAEAFGRKTNYKTPVVESTGTGGGFKLFCAGNSLSTPDINNASRRIKNSEKEKCHKNNVSLIEIKIGFDGIIIANSKHANPIKFTRRILYLALSKTVPEGNKNGGKLIKNPNKKWSDIDPSLPSTKIEVLGPPPTSGTRDAFDELVMEGGCETFPSIAILKKTNKEKFKNVCQSLREDGLYIEVGENDNLTIQKIVINPNAIGIFGYSYLDQNEDKIRGNSVDGYFPTFENISKGSYPVSRPLYFYVKQSHVKSIFGMKDYILEFLNEQEIGDDGYLVDKGLIPLPKKERDSQRKYILKEIN